MRSIESIEDLLPLISLEDVSYLELSGQLRSGDRSVDEDREDEESEFPLRVQTRHDSHSLGVRLAVELDRTAYAIVVDVTASYSLAEQVYLTDAVIQEFVERVALVHLYPYAREAVSDLGRRLGIALPPLPLITLGSGLLERSVQPDRNPDEL